MENLIQIFAYIFLHRFRSLWNNQNHLFETYFFLQSQPNEMQKGLQNSYCLLGKLYAENLRVRSTTSQMVVIFPKKAFL